MGRLFLPNIQLRERFTPSGVTQVTLEGVKDTHMSSAFCDAFKVLLPGVRTTHATKSTSHLLSVSDFGGHYTIFFSFTQGSHCMVHGHVPFSGINGDLPYWAGFLVKISRRQSSRARESLHSKRSSTLRLSRAHRGLVPPVLALLGPSALSLQPWRARIMGQGPHPISCSGSPSAWQWRPLLRCQSSFTYRF